MRKSTGSALAVLVVGQFALQGCAKDDVRDDDVVVTQSAESVAPVGAAGKRTEVDVEGDNSKRNDEAKTDATPTADDQSNAESDVEITRKIRRALTTDDAMSVYAQNIKIITKDGHVVLKGPVRTAAEKTQAEQKAREVAGPSAVTNELVVTPD